MKQRITEEQFNELSTKEKDVWLNWMYDHKYTIRELYPLFHSYLEVEQNLIDGFPSIGQMIEFLEESKVFEEDDCLVNFFSSSTFGIKIGWYDISNEKVEFCDVLWKVVKQILNN